MCRGDSAIDKSQWCLKLVFLWTLIFPYEARMFREYCPFIGVVQLIMPHNAVGCLQGQIQKIQKEGAKEIDDAVSHHSGSICDQTLRLNVKNFQKNTGKKGEGAAPSPPPPPAPLNPPLVR